MKIATKVNNYLGISRRNLSDATANLIDASMDGDIHLISSSL